MAITSGDKGTNKASGPADTGPGAERRATEIRDHVQARSGDNAVDPSAEAGKTDQDATEQMIERQAATREANETKPGDPGSRVDADEDPHAGKDPVINGIRQY
jgi:hypothetical protein